MIVYLQTNQNYQLLTLRENREYVMRGGDALNQMQQNNGQMIKDYISMSYQHRGGNRLKRPNPNSTNNPDDSKSNAT
jgi:hypothetical protein